MKAASIAVLATAVSAKTVTVYKCCTKIPQDNDVFANTYTITYTNDKHEPCTTTVFPAAPVPTTTKKQGVVECHLNGHCETTIIPPPGSKETTVITCPPNKGPCHTTVKTNESTPTGAGNTTGGSNPGSGIVAPTSSNVNSGVVAPTTGSAGINGTTIATSLGSTAASSSVPVSVASESDGLSSTTGTQSASGSESTSGTQTGSGTESSTSTESTACASADSSQTSNLSADDKTRAISILDLHNEKRALHGVCPLSWSSTLATFAQSLADAKDCSSFSLTHTPNNEYGENLSLGWSSNILDGVNVWYDEGKSWDYSTTSYSHFTQMIWKSTTELGCGWKDCSADNNGWYLVCEYNPKGNTNDKGGYFANVLPLV